MEKLKFIIFVEFVALIATLIFNLVLILTNNKMLYELYVIIFIGVFLACLLVLYFFLPILSWFLKIDCKI